MMKVNIKKLRKHAVIPSYSKTGDAGMDLTATSKTIDEHGNVVYGTGLAFEIPEGFVGLLFPRSSNAKTDLMLTNHVGVLDSGFRGEVMFKFVPYSRLNPSDRVVKNEVFTDDLVHRSHTTVYADDYTDYSVGDRIGQIIIMPYPTIEFNEVAELNTTERGSNGYGSTGK